MMFDWMSRSANGADPTDDLKGVLHRSLIFTWVSIRGVPPSRVGASLARRDLITSMVRGIQDFLMESSLLKRSSLRMARGGCGMWPAISKKGSVVGQAGACQGGVKGGFAESEPFSSLRLPHPSLSLPHPSLSSSHSYFSRRILTSWPRNLIFSCHDLRSSCGNMRANWNLGARIGGR